MYRGVTDSNISIRNAFDRVISEYTFLHYNENLDRVDMLSTILEELRFRITT